MSALNEGTHGAGEHRAGSWETRVLGLDVGLNRSRLKTSFPPPPWAGKGAGPGSRGPRPLASQRAALARAPGSREDKEQGQTLRPEQDGPAPCPRPGSPSPLRLQSAPRPRREGAGSGPGGGWRAGPERDFGSSRGIWGAGPGRAVRGCPSPTPPAAANADNEAGGQRPSSPAAQRWLRGSQPRSNSPALHLLVGAAWSRKLSMAEKMRAP